MSAFPTDTGLRRQRTVLILVPAGLVLLAALYVLAGLGFDFGYVIPRRLMKLGAMVIGGVAVALSAITFQTLAGNRILTPAVMGYEAVCLMTQALLVLALGTGSLALFGGQGTILVTLAAMLAWSLLLDQTLFRRAAGDVWFLMLIGIVLTMVITTITQFIQLRISPGEFAIFQGFAQVSFDRAEPLRLISSALMLALVAALLWRRVPVLDVLALGREQAMSLGIDHPRELRLLLALVAIMVAISASLIGPTAFMGIFVANIARAIAPGPGHRLTLPLGAAVAVGLFLLAELLASQIFDYRTTAGILVNLICGAWFLALMLRRRSFA